MPANLELKLEELYAIIGELEVTRRKLSAELLKLEKDKTDKTKQDALAPHP